MNKEELKERVKKIIKTRFKRYPFKTKIDRWTIERLEKFLKVWDKE